MKKRLLAWILSFALALSLLPVGVLAAEPHPFQDVPSDHWANEAVQYAYDEGLMDGVGPTTFAPRRHPDPGHVRHHPGPAGWGG